MERCPPSSGRPVIHFALNSTHMQQAHYFRYMLHAENLKRITGRRPKVVHSVQRQP